MTVMDGFRFGVGLLLAWSSAGVVAVFLLFWWIEGARRGK